MVSALVARIVAEGKQRPPLALSRLDAARVISAEFLGPPGTELNAKFWVMGQWQKLIQSGNGRDRLPSQPPVQSSLPGRQQQSYLMGEERVQRRLAAILAADVVGFSRLMEADEAGTMAALKVRRKDVLDQLVARHQGRIFKPMEMAC
jgi:hypothetical protein